MTTLIHSLIELWTHFGITRKRQFFRLLFLMMVASIAEVVSIGSVLPFLGILVAPELVFEYPVVQILADYLQASRPQELQLPLTIIFSIAALFAGAVRLLLLYFTINFSVMIGADFSANIYKRTLYQPYLVHASRNSSEVINSITTKISTIVYSVVMPVLTIISSTIMLLFVLIVLLLIDPYIAIVAIFGFGSLYMIVAILTRHKLSKNSVKVAQESTKVVKFLQEGLGGIRDILIDGYQEIYCKMYKNSDYPLRKAQGENQFIAGSPRFAMEALSMVFIAAFAYILIGDVNESGSVIPILGTFAIGAQRMLPVLQQAYAAVANLRGSSESLNDINILLSQPLPNYADESYTVTPFEFSNNIVLERLGFHYGNDTPIVLTNINLEIKKGSRVGFVGVTGSGKSTLIDIIMGLLPPAQGKFLVDGVEITDLNTQSWQRNISHVPQAIFLTDDSIEANIAFGIPKDKIDYESVVNAAKQAQIEDIIESWPDKYQTFVGERGIRLSGGQRQRIGIARALYKKTDVIILDEATSALDSETEGKIMETIEKFDKNITVLIIAHRTTTLKNCNQIVEIQSGAIHRIYNSYNDYHDMNFN